MSYGMLRHGNQSSHAVTHVESPPPSPTESDSDYEDHIGLGLRGGEVSDEEGYELKDLTFHEPHEGEIAGRDGESYSRLNGFEGVDEGSDFRKSRRASNSTTQSFMLYTPSEEKTVIKKFDRRLVLFVALLYMLSFLDRSSTSSFCSEVIQRSLTTS